MAGNLTDSVDDVGDVESSVSGISDVLTNEALPKTSATITVRIIKSFEYRTEKNLVIHAINLETTTVVGLKERARQAIRSESKWKPFRTVQLDTIKKYTNAHGAKTTNLIINLDNDETEILNDDTQLLSDAGLENESEVSFFNKDLYEAFKDNPETKW